MKEEMPVKGRENPLLYLFRKIWRYSKDNKRNVVQFWIMFIVANVTSLIVQPLLIAKIITTLQKEGVTPDNFWFLIQLLSASVVVTLLFWGLHGPARCKERANAFQVRAGYCKFLIRGVLTLPLDWHAEHHSGDTIDKIEKGRQGIYAVAADSFVTIYSIGRLVVSVVMLTYFSHSAGIIVLVMLALSTMLILKFDKKIMENYRKLNRADNAVSASVIDAISHINTVITLRVEKPVFDSISQKIDAPFALYKVTNRLNETKWFLVSLCCITTWALVLGMYFHSHVVSGKAVLLGSVFLLIRYLDEMTKLFERFADMYSEVIQRFTRVQNAEEIAESFTTEGLTNHLLPRDWKALQIQNLNFAYRNAEGGISHLHNLSLSVKRKERIALVGWSGSGKSTFLKVFRDLHQPEEVSLCVDGVSMEGGFAGIKRDVALIPQQPEIFATSIRENITVGVEYPDEMIRRYMDMACFSKVADALPRGIESMINERGVNLSGGERQRLALARGLLASEGKSIILIDEPTSSVDEASKQKIYSNIFREFPDSCIIFATHELHLLPLFDRIHMFEKGRIVGSGTAEHLHETCPQFRELCARSKEELVLT